jgi:hypothetical protein
MGCFATPLVATRLKSDGAAGVLMSSSNLNKQRVLKTEMLLPTSTRGDGTPGAVSLAVQGRCALR